MTESESTGVAIVGAGPSGLMVAMELARAQVPVVVLEKRGEPALSRAGVLQPRVLEIFAMRGMADEMIERARATNGKKYRTSGGVWAGLPGIDYGLLESEFPYILILSQIEIERMLAEKCRELGVEIRRGADVSAVAEDGEEVLVSYQTNAGAESLRASYVVGADGARSAVRESAGIGWTGRPARNMAVNVDGDIPYPFERAVELENNPRGWGLSYPLTESVTRFGLIDASRMLGVGREGTITEAEAFESLRTVFGTDFGVKTARVSQFHDALYRADRMDAGRVFLVGESVRVHYPAAGVGMNFCLQDAFNLAWKLAADLQGWAPDGLLATYDTERGPVVDDLLNSVQVQTGIQFGFGEESLALKAFLMQTLLPIAEVQKRIGEQLSGLATHYGERGQLVGSATRDVGVAGGGTLYPSIRPDGYLLASAPGVAAPDPRWGGRVTRVELSDAARADAMVIRPDGHVAVAGSLEDCVGWLDRAVTVPG